MSLFRRVAGTIMAGFIGAIILWLVLPLMYSIYTIVLAWSIIDETDPIIAQMIEYGELTFMVLGVAVIMVIGWTWLSYATGTEARDVRF